MKDEYHPGGQAASALVIHRIRLGKIHTYSMPYSIRNAIFEAASNDHRLRCFCHLIRGGAGPRGPDRSLIGVTANLKHLHLRLRGLPNTENAADLDPVSPVSNRDFTVHRGASSKFTASRWEGMERKIGGDDDIALVGSFKSRRVFGRHSCLAILDPWPD